MTTTKSTKSFINKMLVLGIIYKEESYGYQIIDKVADLSNQSIILQEGTLYPLLKKLKSSELVRSTWKKTKEGKSRKYYTATEKGKAVYKQLRKEWLSMNQIVESL